MNNNDKKLAQIHESLVNGQKKQFVLQGKDLVNIMYGNCQDFQSLDSTATFLDEYSFWLIGKVDDIEYGTWLMKAIAAFANNH